MKSKDLKLELTKNEASSETQKNTVVLAVVGRLNIGGQKGDKTILSPCLPSLRIIMGLPLLENEKWSGGEFDVHPLIRARRFGKHG